MSEDIIKTDKEIEIMRGLGKILSSFFDELKKDIKPGTDVWDLETKFLKLCEESNVNPSCKGYGEGELPPFPTGLCISINEESVHCFPKKGVILKEGDIINIDTVIDYAGLYVDSAFCQPVGKVSQKDLDLLNASKTALNESIEKVKDGVKIGLISNTMHKNVKAAGFDVLKDYAGHGIGHSMHEYPEIPCYGNKHEGPKLKEGMTICIESLVCEGNDKVENVSEWETRMRDGKNFCIFEHTILVKRNGYEILTK
jgi:methionyl aminopeptidase